MTGTYLGRAFAPVADLYNYCHNLWDETAFRLYYHTLFIDPHELVSPLPVDPATTTALAAALDRARRGLIDGTATLAASGSHGKPSWGNIWAGFSVHLQNGLRPALEIAMRTGMHSPLRLALIGALVVLACDHAYGGALRDHASQLFAGINTEAGKANSAPANDTTAARRVPAHHATPAASAYTAAHPCAPETKPSLVMRHYA